MVGILFLWCMGFAARSLAPIAAFVVTSSIHSSVIAFCHSHHLVPGIFLAELGLNIVASSGVHRIEEPLLLCIVRDGSCWEGYFKVH